MLTKQEVLKIKRFLEEFSWLMDTYSKIDLRKASALIDDSIGEISQAKRAVGSYESKNPNIQFLTGALPAFFLDEAIFKTNDDIAEFAGSVLGLKIPRHHKKSKYEIIGHIVCETNKLDEEGLGNLVGKIAQIVGDDNRKEIIARSKDDNSFSWNEMIQILTRD